MVAQDHSLITTHLLNPPPIEADFPFWYKLAYSADEPVLVLGPGAARVALPLGNYSIRTIALRQPGEPAPDVPPDLPVTPLLATPPILDTIGPVGLVIAPANSLNLIAPDQEARALLGALARLVRLGGRVALALEVPNLPHLAQASLPGGTPLQLVQQVQAPAGETLLLWEQRTCDPYRQTLTRTLIMERIDAQGQSRERHHTTHTQRYLWPHELPTLLEASGLHLESSYGSYHNDPLSATSTTQLWVARKV